MNALWDKIDAKLITSVGGILLAGFLSFTIYKVLTNDLPHIGEAINRQAEVQGKTNDILIKFSENVSANNEILRSLETRMKNGK